jgi:hypothetical protein
MAVLTVEREDALRFRFRRHELDREPDSLPDPGEVALLDYGVQDTGPDGAAWALAVRGAPTTAGDDRWAGLALAWTLRGAPHAYRRRDLPAVAVATAPLSEADAAKRIFDAARPLKAAGIGPLDALRTVAGHQRAIVSAPTVKGEVSARLTTLLDEPYLRFCRPCNATHVYEQTFRLPALQAGLELEPGTSPPVLRRVPGLAPPCYQRLGTEAAPAFDAMRNHLRFYGPARPRDAAPFLDAPVRDVTRRWPADVVEVVVAGEGAPRSLLAGDADELRSAPTAPPARALRLLGPYDPYLQGRDRELLVPDEARRRALWPVLGRPGAVVAGGEVVGTWRARTAGRSLTVTVEPWTALGAAHRALVGDEAARLAAFRGLTLAALAWPS